MVNEKEGVFASSFFIKVTYSKEKTVMKIPVVFEVISDRRIVKEVVMIEHDFQPIPPFTKYGLTFPETSIEEQVLEYLDSTDKFNMMVEHDWDIILNYYPQVSRATELEEFIEFSKPALEMYPSLREGFGRVMAEMFDLEFGVGKSNYTKFKEILKGVDIAHKAASGTINALEKILNTSYESKKKINK